MRLLRLDVSLSFIALAAATAACASAGATYRSGVAPKSFEKPPFYAGASVTPRQPRVAHLPVRYQRGAEQGTQFEPKGGEPFSRKESGGGIDGCWLVWQS